MGIEKKPALKEEISRGEERTVEAGENMVHVKGGCFKMVCSNWALYCDSHFMPKHEVCREDISLISALLTFPVTAIQTGAPVAALTQRSSGVL